MDIKKIFESLAEKNLGFSLRLEQLDMACRIGNAIVKSKDDDVIPAEMFEGQTGTGKTLAYLVPILCSGKRAIISVNTKPLQQQISSEIERLAQFFPDVRYACAYGMSNYACRKRVDKLANPEICAWVDSQWNSLGSGMKRDFSMGGSKANIGLVWSGIETDSQLCTNKCPYFSGGCFYHRAIQERDAADIIIANHDLLLADELSGHRVFSAYHRDVVILDEAHTFPAKAVKAYTISFSEYGLMRRIQMLQSRLDEIFDGQRVIDLESDKYSELISDVLYDFPIDQVEPVALSGFSSNTSCAVAKLKRKIDEDIVELNFGGYARERFTKEKQILENIQDSVDKIFGKEDLRYLTIFKVENSPRRGPFKKISRVPISPATELAGFWNCSGAKVLTSATLSIGGDFSYIKRNLGVTNSNEKVYESPFDPGHVAIYIPGEEILPRTEHYNEKISQEIINIMTQMKGRTLFLFTARDEMEEIYTLLPESLQKQVLLQFDPTNVADFKAKLKSSDQYSIFGLDAFWEGVDIPGAALSCVCVVKIPFLNPKEMLVDALKRRYVDEFGEQGRYRFFLEIDLPSALIKLKQGLGRLIRNENDYGVLALLDNRFINKSYRQDVLSIIGKYRAFNSFAEAKEAVFPQSSYRVRAMNKMMKSKRAKKE